MRQEFSEQRHKEEELAELSIWQWMPTTEPPPCGITSGRPRLRHSPPSFFFFALAPSSDWSTEITLREWAWQSDRITKHVTEWHTEGRETKQHFSFFTASHLFSNLCFVFLSSRFYSKRQSFIWISNKKNKTKHKRSGKICYKCTVRGNWSSSARRLWKINLQVSVYWLSKLVQALIPWTLYRAENPHRHIKLVLIRWSLGVEDFLTLH